MPTYKDEKTGLWYCKFVYTNWTGERKQKKKKGFLLQRDAKQYELDFLSKTSDNCDMTFQALTDIYMEDCAVRLKPTTYQGKQIVFSQHILPYFKHFKINEIQPMTIRRWQTKLLSSPKKYKPTYLRTLNNQLSAIFNFAVKYYGLKENPVHKSGSIGKKRADLNQFWTPEEFKAALEAVKGVENVYPFAVFANSQQGDSFTNMLLRMYGGKFVNDEGNAFTINDEKGVQALQMIVDMKNEGLLAPGGETLSQGDVYQMFLNKNLAVVTLNNLTYNNLVAGLKNGSIEEPFEFQWAYYPNGEGVDPYCLSYVKGGAIFNTGDEAEIIASKLFIRFFNSEPYTEASKVLIPVRESKLEELKSENQDPHIIEAAEALDHTISITGRVPGYVSSRSYYFPEIQAVLTDQKTPKEALDSFVESANEAISKAAERSVILNPQQ